MARRNGITEHLMAEFATGTGIDAQPNDQGRATDRDQFGRLMTYIAGDTTADDGEYSREETGQAIAGRWRATEAVSSLLAESVAVAHPLMPDNTEEEITVAVPGAVVGEGYVIGVIGTLSNGVNIELEEDHTTDSLTFKVINNSGADLVAGDITVNVWKV